MSLFVLDQVVLNNLIYNLIKDGYDVIGPVIKDGVILLDSIKDLKRHPAGVTDLQAPGKYRTEKIQENRIFGFNNGPDSWKKYLFPPEKIIFKAKKNPEGEIEFSTDSTPLNKYAFFGVRSCELEAIKIHDAVLKDGSFPDQFYSDLRKESLFIAVNCTVSSDTCFCASMNTGPEVKNGYDVVLTEIIENGKSIIIAESGSGKGKSILEALAPMAASENQIQESRKAVASVSTKQKRSINIESVRKLLKTKIASNLFDTISEKCMTCSNCTMVCPTCFCYNIEDTTDITGETASRVRKWDSCFCENFSYIHGGKIRESKKSRYRQWLTHKLTNWFDQFGSSGCVGCGRCISWCPAGIDITESAAVFLESVEGKT